MDIETRSSMLQRYADGPRAVAEAAASLSPADLDRRDGQEWTAREVIHHVADSELIEGMRLRRMLAESNPTLQWVDEAEDARRLHYERPIESSLAMYQALVTANASVVEALSEDEWRRFGTHTVVGRYTVEDWLRKMSQHGHDHVAQMLRATGRGTP